MPASTDQVEMPGAAFVPVCVKVHDSPPRKRWGTSFNRQLPKQFLGRLPIAASPRRPRAGGGLLLLTGIPDLLRVIRVVLTMVRPLPVYPDKRISSEPDGMSQRCK